MSGIKTLENLVKKLKELSDKKEKLSLGERYISNPELDQFLKALPNESLQLKAGFKVTQKKSSEDATKLKEVIVEGLVLDTNTVDIHPLAHAKFSPEKVELLFKPDEEPGQLKVQVKFSKGKVVVGEDKSLEIPVQGRWIDNAKIGLVSAETVTTDKDIDKVAKIISDGDLQLVLTDALRTPFKNVELNKAAFIFDLKKQQNTLIVLKAESDQKVRLIDLGERAIEITKLGIGVEAEFERYSPAVDDEVTHPQISGSAELFGELKIGDPSYKIALTQFSKNDALLSVLKQDEGLPDIGLVAQMIGGDDFRQSVDKAINWLKGEPLGLTLPALERLQIAFNPSGNGSLRRVEIASSAIIAPFGAPAVKLRSYLRFQPQPQSTFPAIYLRLGLDKETPIKFRALLAGLLQEEEENLRTLPETNVTELSLDIAPVAKYYALSLAVASTLEIDLGILKVGITQVTFEVEYADQAPTVKGSGTFYLGKLPFFIGIDYEKEDKPNFKFQGGIPEHKEFKLKAFLKDVKENLPVGNFNPELALNGIIVKKLQLSFSTASKVFAFVTEYEMEQEQKDPVVNGIKGKVEVKIEPDPDDKNKKKTTAKIHGELKVGADTKFETTIDLIKQTIDSKVATSVLNIEELATLMGYASFTMPRGLNLGLKEAKFSYAIKERKLNLQATSQALEATAFLRSVPVPKKLGIGAVATVDGEKKQAYVVGMEMKDVSLDKIPIVGEVLRNVSFLKLDPLRFLIGTVDAKEFSIEPNNPKTKIDVWRGISLQGILKVGDSKKKFNQKLYAPKKKKTQLSPNITTPPEMALGKVTWLELQRNIGILQIKRVGFQYGKFGEGENAEFQICLLIDAGIKSSVVLLTFYGLSVRFPPKAFDPKNLRIGLEGIQAGVNAGGIQVRGGFLRTEDEEYWNYVGEAAMRFQQYGFAGVGGYSASKKGDKPASMFTFMYFGIPFGDPTVKFTGLAGGFGFNREIKIPPLEKLEEFELIKIVQGGSEPTDLRKIMDNFPVAPGNAWLAAGVKMTLVEVLDVVALPVVSFGTQLEMQIFGVGGMKVPQSEPVIGLEMILQGGLSLSDDRGQLIVGGILTKQSYLLIKDAKIEGGVALGFWFPMTRKGSLPSDFAGDFVYTLGGYHPRFDRPDHYPNLPAIGLGCKLDDYITFKANYYFAITPACIMLGGKLALAFQYRKLKASFTVAANFLIAWKPFKYDANIKIVVEASVTTKFIVTKTISATFKAELQLSGPDLVGEFQFKIALLNYKLSFGNKREPEAAVTWDIFKKSYLETERKDQVLAQHKRSEVCQVRIARGLVKELKADKNLIGWVVDPGEVVVIATSSVPAKQLRYNGQRIAPDQANNRGFGVGMVGVPVDSFKSQLEVAVRPAESEHGYLSADAATSLTTEPVVGNLPRSLWSPEPIDRERPVAGGSGSMIGNVLKGVRFGGKTKPSGNPCEVEIENLGHKKTDRLLSLAQPFLKPEQVSSTDPWECLESTIACREISNTRKKMLTKLRACHFSIFEDVQVDKLSQGEHQLMAAPQLSKWVDAAKQGQ